MGTHKAAQDNDAIPVQHLEDIGDRGCSRESSDGRPSHGG